MPCIGVWLEQAHVDWAVYWQTGYTNLKSSVLAESFVENFRIRLQVFGYCIDAICTYIQAETCTMDNC